jgi:hypothetical protein
LKDCPGADDNLGYSLHDKDFLEESSTPRHIARDTENMTRRILVFGIVVAATDTLPPLFEDSDLDRQETKCVITEGGLPILRGVPHAVSVKHTAP